MISFFIMLFRPLLDSPCLPRSALLLLFLMLEGSAALNSFLLLHIFQHFEVVSLLASFS